MSKHLEDVNDYSIAEILLVEDDEADIELTKMALRDSKLKVNLNIVNDGQECLDYLTKKGTYSEAKKPDLIFLDLNMPRLNGQKTLAKIKEQEEIKDIPVVILTTSDQDQDIEACYKLGCNCYVTKPVGLEGFIKVMNEIEHFWFTVVRIPHFS